MKFAAFVLAAVLMTASSHAKPKHEPVVLIPTPMVHSRKGQSAILECFVPTDPRANVTWYKNSLLIDNSNARYRVYDNGARRQLLIWRVGLEDFGNYSCLATNSMGKQQGVITLTGKPERPEVDPVVQGVPMPGGNRAWRISWATRSYSNVIQYRLLYRKIPKLSSMQGPDSDMLARARLIPDPNLHHSESDISSPWNVIVLPHVYDRTEISPDSKIGARFNHTYSYDIPNLTPGVEYEAQVQASNKFGWSQMSEAARFMAGQQEGNTAWCAQCTLLVGHIGFIIIIFTIIIIYFSYICCQCKL